MALGSRERFVVRAENLERRENWEEVGSGGFGHVYKTRHSDWCFDVAVKILKRNASHFMFGDKEARFMEQASCEFVLKLYGVYHGPEGERGLVTEYMRRGSIKTLQDKLEGPPSWPLAFRLAHQTALAMNFLHVQDIVHLDLKPSNILLSDELHARLADFGLSTVSMSVVGRITDDITGPQGTFKFMPPEAFEDSYKPVRAFDIYSFAILLWSIFSGKEPYPGRNYSDVEFRICEGDRPGCRNNQEDLLELQIDGIEELVDLMRRCWAHNPRDRPHFKDILKKTERLFSQHSSSVDGAVLQVKKTLDSPNQAHGSLQRHEAQFREVVKNSSGMEVEQVSPRGGSRQILTRGGQGSQLHDVVDNQLNLPAASARGDSSKTKTIKEKAQFVDDHREELVQEVTLVLAIAERLGVGKGKMVHSEVYSQIEAKETSQDKVRVLYRKTLLSGGDKVKAAFYDALKIHEASLMEKLGE